MPTNPDVAPPGPYMLFLLNDQGVPSDAAMFFLEAGSTATVQQAPAAPSGSGGGYSW